jgi:hypothetical protein
MQVVDANLVRSRYSLAGHPQVIEMICPHCLKQETFTVKRWSEHAGRMAAAEAPCPRCNIEVFFMNLMGGIDSPGEPTLYAHPDPVGRTPMEGAGYLASLSPPLGRTYDAALKHYNQGEWGTVALTIRHLLEGLAMRLLTDTHPDGPLPRQLETLAKGVDLAAPLEDIAHLLAPDGVFGKQFQDATTIGQNTAEQLLELTEQLIAYLVVLPGAMSELKDRIATAPVPLRRGMTGMSNSMTAG